MFLNIQPKPFLIQPEPQPPSYFRQPSEILPSLGQLDCCALAAGTVQWSASTSSSLAFRSSTFLVPSSPLTFLWGTLVSISVPTEQRPWFCCAAGHWQTSGKQTAEDIWVTLSNLRTEESGCGSSIHTAGGSFLWDIRGEGKASWHLLV